MNRKKSKYYSSQNVRGVISFRQLVLGLYLQELSVRKKHIPEDAVTARECKKNIGNFGQKQNLYKLIQNRNDRSRQ